MADQHSYRHFAGRGRSRELVARFYAAAHLYRACDSRAQDASRMERRRDCRYSGGGGGWPAAQPGPAGGNAGRHGEWPAPRRKGGWLNGALAYDACDWGCYLCHPAVVYRPAGAEGDAHAALEGAAFRANHGVTGYHHAGTAPAQQYAGPLLPESALAGGYSGGNRGMAHAQCAADNRGGYGRVMGVGICDRAGVVGDDVLVFM